MAPVPTVCVCGHHRSGDAARKQVASSACCAHPYAAKHAKPRDACGDSHGHADEWPCLFLVATACAAVRASLTSVLRGTPCLTGLLTLTCLAELGLADEQAHDNGADGDATRASEGVKARSIAEEWARDSPLQGLVLR